MDLNSFGDTAKGLAKNPLGIIALFIVLVYGIAGLVLSVAAKSLSADQKTIMIWFLAAFPFAVLFVFAWLVANHHSKLYAPEDYRTDESFWHATPPESQRIRLKAEVDALADNEPPDENREISVTAPAAESVGDSGAAVAATRRDLRGKVLVSEELALREIEREFGVAVNRQASVGVTEFDGVFARSGHGYGVEVKYVRGKRINPGAICQQLNAAAASVARLGWRNFGIVLALVVDGLTGRQLEQQVDALREALAGLNGPVELRVYQLSELQERYGA